MLDSHCCRPVPKRVVNNAKEIFVVNPGKRVGPIGSGFLPLTFLASFRNLPKLNGQPPVEPSLL
jgi:hypothetical protein